MWITGYQFLANINVFLMIDFFMFADLGGVPPPPLNERKPLVAKLMTEQGCSPKMQDQAKERHHCLNQQFWISIRKIPIFSVLSITVIESKKDTS